MPLKVIFYSFSPLRLKAYAAEIVPKRGNQLSESKHSVRIERSVEMKRENTVLSLIHISEPTRLEC